MNLESTTPFFTIGIPVYNAQKYLETCVNSVLKQSFRDFELVLVNDGSSDDSLKILNNLMAEDSRIVLMDQSNGGISSASNCILSVALIT